MFRSVRKYLLAIFLLPPTTSELIIQVQLIKVVLHFWMWRRNTKVKVFWWSRWEHLRWQTDCASLACLYSSMNSAFSFKMTFTCFHGALLFFSPRLISFLYNVISYNWCLFLPNFWFHFSNCLQCYLFQQILLLLLPIAPNWDG